MSPEKSYSLYDVFGVARELPLNYVERPDVDQTLVDALTQRKHIVVHGSSKQGKTCLRKYTLKESDYVITTCSNKWALKELHTAVLKAAGFTVEGTTTKTVSGDFKVTAKASGAIKIPLLGTLGAEAGAEAGHGTEVQTTDTSLELDPADVNDIIAALDRIGAPQFIVLEDFHYLPEETQKDFAAALKAFHEESRYTFIVVGVWLDENRLIQHNGDLSGRVISINADKWTRDELTSVIADGADLLNVRFDAGFVDELLDGAFESVWIIQEVCKLACERSGVFKTHAGNEPVAVGDTASDFIEQVVDQHSARFNGFLMNFAQGFQNTRREMYRWLLYTVVVADPADLDRGLLFSEVSAVINGAHPDAPINSGNITQALHSTASLQIARLGIKPIILDYDLTKRSLNVVDRSFMIWLRHQDGAALTATLDLSFA